MTLRNSISPIALTAALMSSDSLALINLDTASGALTYARELNYSAAIPLNDTVNTTSDDLTGRLGFGVTVGQTRYIRLDYGNAVYATSSGAATAVDCIAGVDDCVIVFGGSAGQSNVIYGFTAGASRTQDASVTIPGASAGFAVTSTAAPVTVTYALYDTASNAVNGTNALYSRTADTQRFSPGLQFSITPKTATAAVADSYRRFRDQLGGSINVTRAALGTVNYGTAPGVLGRNGSPVSVSSLVTASSRMVLTGNFGAAGTVFLATDTSSTCSPNLAGFLNSTESIATLFVGTTPYLGDICYNVDGTTAIEAQTVLQGLDVTAAVNANTVDTAAATLGTIVLDGAPIAFGPTLTPLTPLSGSTTTMAGGNIGSSTSSSIAFTKNGGSGGGTTTLNCAATAGTVFVASGALQTLSFGNTVAPVVARFTLSASAQNGTVGCTVSAQGGGVSNLVYLFNAPAGQLLTPDRRVSSLTPFGNAPSRTPISDAAGRYILFQSRASNLVGGDSNGSADIFRVDTQFGGTVRVSRDNAGAQITGDSMEPGVSADGNFAVFVAPDAGVAQVLGESKTAAQQRIKQGGFGIYLRDLISGTTQRVGPGLANGSGSEPQISANGNAVVFTGTNSDPAMGATGQDNVFRVPLTRIGNELTPGSLECVSCKSRSVTGKALDNADGASRDAVVSADGRYVAYETVAKNLTPGTASPCPGSTAEIILRDLISGTIQRVSPPPGLAAFNCGSSGSSNPSIDYSGLHIAFESDQPLKPGDINFMPDVFTVVAGSSTFARPSEQANGSDANGASTQAAISGDGQTVVFVSAATNLDASFNDSNGQADVHAKVLDSSGGPERLSKSTSGVEANAAANQASLNYNGNLIAFDSAASNLVSGDSNAQNDVFQRVLPANVDVVFAAGFE